jgi:hypothetical protein
MKIARMDGNIVINIEMADQEWIDAQPDPSVFIVFDDDNYATIGGDYIDGYFYEPQPYPSWTRSEGRWIPPTPRPDDGNRYFWDEESKSWIKENN